MTNTPPHLADTRSRLHAALIAPVLRLQPIRDADGRVESVGILDATGSPVAVVRRREDGRIERRLIDEHGSLTEPRIISPRRPAAEPKRDLAAVRREAAAGHRRRW